MLLFKCVQSSYLQQFSLFQSLDSILRLPLNFKGKGLGNSARSSAQSDRNTRISNHVVPENQKDRHPMTNAQTQSLSPTISGPSDAIAGKESCTTVTEKSGPSTTLKRRTKCASTQSEVAHSSNLHLPELTES